MGILYGVVLLIGVALLGIGGKQFFIARKAQQPVSVAIMFLAIGFVVVVISVAVLMDWYTRPPVAPMGLFGIVL